MGSNLYMQCQWILYRSKVKGQVDSGGDEVGAFLLDEQTASVPPLASTGDGTGSSDQSAGETTVPTDP